jgi:hypothetical protein
MTKRLICSLLTSLSTERTRMRIYRVATVALTVAASMLVASHSSSAVADGKAKSFTLVLASDVSFHDAVLASAERQLHAHPVIISALSAAATRSVTGKGSLVFPGLPRDVEAQQLELRQTVHDLAISSRGSRTDNSLSGDPLSLPIKGQRIDSNHAWLISTDHMWMAAYTCGPLFPDDCVETDRLQGRVTINPGALISRIDYNILYSPNSGGFVGSHFEWWSIVDGDPDLTANFPNDGSGLYPNGPSSGIFNATSDEGAHGRSLAHAVLLWGDFHWQDGGQSFLRAGGRTDRAFCASDPPDNSCLY